MEVFYILRQAFMMNGRVYLMRRRYHKPRPTNDWPYVTESVVFEILSWVPAGDLVRYKTVCKQWRSLIDDPNFIDLHKSRARQIIVGTAKCPSRTVITPDGGEIFISNIRHGQIMGSSLCGLLCVQTHYNCYHLRNIATGMSFPLPPLVSNTYAIEMRPYPIPQSRQYTVVAICRSSQTITSYWGLFTVGVDSGWRNQIFPLEVDAAVVWSTYVLCESSVTFLVKYRYPRGKAMESHSFDPCTGQLTSRTPPFNLEHERNRKLVSHDWDGKFAMSSIGGEDIYTWILDNHETNKWRYVTTASPRKGGKSFLGIQSVCFVHQGKMWLRSRNRDVFSLDLLTGKMDKITGNATRTFKIYDLESYKSTFDTPI